MCFTGPQMDRPLPKSKRSLTHPSQPSILCWHFLCQRHYESGADVSLQSLKNHRISLHERGRLELLSYAWIPFALDTQSLTALHHLFIAFCGFWGSTWSFTLRCRFNTEQLQCFGISCSGTLLRSSR